MLTDGTLLKRFLYIHTASEQKTTCLDWFSAHSRYISKKFFSREPSGSVVFDQRFRLWMKCFEEICFHLTRSEIVKTNACGIDGGRLVLGLLYSLNM